MDRTCTLGMMSLEEYLSFEERSSSRHEYVAGEVFAMTVVGEVHDAHPASAQLPLERVAAVERVAEREERIGSVAYQLPRRQ